MNWQMLQHLIFACANFDHDQSWPLQRRQCECKLKHTSSWCTQPKRFGRFFQSFTKSCHHFRIVQQFVHLDLVRFKVNRHTICFFQFILVDASNDEKRSDSNILRCNAKPTEISIEHFERRNQIRVIVVVQVGASSNQPAKVADIARLDCQMHSGSFFAVNSTHCVYIDGSIYDQMTNDWTFILIHDRQMKQTDTKRRREIKIDVGRTRYDSMNHMPSLPFLS